MIERPRISFEFTDIDIRDIWDTPECIDVRNGLILNILKWECDDDTTPNRFERLKEIWLIKTEV